MSGSEAHDLDRLIQGRVKKTRYSKSQSVLILEQLSFQKLRERYPNNPYHPKQKYTDFTTKGLSKCVIDYSTFLGYHAKRVNITSAIRDNRKTLTDVLGRKRTVGTVQWIKGNTKADTTYVSAVINGLNVKIEVKSQYTGDNKQSKEQIAYQKEIQAAGGIYLIVTSFQDFYLWLNEFCKEQIKHS